MTIIENTREAKPLCSVYSRTQEEDPGGSAPNWKRCVVIELAKPWEEEVAESRHFPSKVKEVLDSAAQRGYETRLQCVMPDREYSVKGYTRVIYYSRPEGPFATYSKDEYQVPRADVGRLVAALLESPDELRRFDSYRQETRHIRDILVCTHGSHDVCCATFGYPIYSDLRDRYARDLGGKLRVWQVSHLGGHRFAPNLLDMPEGRNWVRLGVENLDALVYRNRPVSEMRAHYRGWVALDGPHEQAVEREVFMREGWDWAGLLISGRVVKMEQEGQPAQVRIDFADQEGSEPGAYEATVEQDGTAPRVGCLSGDDTGAAPQYVVSWLVKVG